MYPFDTWNKFFSEFAGPVATVLAAAVVAYYQKAQTEIARNKLRLELRAERKDCYRAIKDLFSTVACFRGYDNSAETGNILIKVRDLYNVLTDGSFILSFRTRRFILESKNACEDLIMYIGTSEPKGDAPRELFAEEAATKTANLRKLYQRLDDEFERELRIEA